MVYAFAMYVVRRILCFEVLNNLRAQHMSTQQQVLYCATGCVEQMQVIVML